VYFIILLLLLYYSPCALYWALAARRFLFLTFTQSIIGINVRNKNRRAARAQCNAHGE